MKLSNSRLFSALKKYTDLRQLISYGIVGTTVTAIELALMILFTDVMGIRYLLSSALSFLISVVINYFLSVRFVYDVSDNKSRTVQMTVFIVLSAVGLGLDQSLMRFIVERIGISYKIAKLFSVAIVAIFNFITRKKFLEN